jgi:hyperosmotically inducible periplasmic protein
VKPPIAIVGLVITLLGLASKPVLPGPGPAAKHGTSSQVNDPSPERTNGIRKASRSAERKIEKALQGRSMLRTSADLAITARIKTVLLGDETVSASDINVDTLRGVVHLRGTVTSKAEAQKAVAIAQKTRGVKAVKNHLKIVPGRNTGGYHRTTR